ncbi:MAG: molybdopterin synthase catalytic subunit [Polaribacter sp.]|jgi:molybdopterin synthase catalytic subunit|tara:strand:+ start:376 stop:867 length:492 start_codon:yes stop_codon:yes gene_type:complete
MSIYVSVQTKDFTVANEYQRLRQITHSAGAVVTFSGLVRDFEVGSDEQGQKDSLKSLTLQHYPEMTERLLEEIIEESQKRWSVLGVTVIHRVGRLLPNDQIVFVGVASTHRDDAFQAAQFLMDYLKTRATFWKKADVDGTEQWLEAKGSDTAAASRWEGSKHD